MEFIDLNLSYIRYSDHNQDDGYSIEYQISEIEEFAERNGLTIHKHFIDQAQTATKVAGREQFFALMDAVKRGEVKTIIVYKMNRMFRNSLESQKYRKLFRKMNVRIMSVTETIDETTSAGRLMTSVLSDIDQYTSENISDHVKSSMREMARQGFFTGGVVQYGFRLETIQNGKKKRQKLVPDPAEAAVVRKMFELYAKGFSLFDIQQYLMDNNIKSRKGKMIPSTTISRYLQAQIYIGVYRFKTKGYDDLIIKDVIDPIVDRETWDLVQERKAKNHKPTPRNRNAPDQPRKIYSLTGFIKCAKCGNFYIGQKSGCPRDKDRANRRYYVCQTKIRLRQCSAMNIRKQYIEKVVLDAITENILNEKAIKTLSAQILDQYKQSPSEIHQQIRKLRREKTALETRISNLIENQIEGKAAAKITQRKVDEAESQLHNIEKQLFRLSRTAEKVVTQESVEKYLYDMLDMLPTTNQDVLRLIFETFLDHVELSASEIKIFLKIYASDNAHKNSNGTPFVDLCETVERYIFANQR